MYSLEYLVEKFEQAVFDLATGESDARSRLEMAYRRTWTWVGTQTTPNPGFLRSDKSRNPQSLRVESCGPLA